MRRSGFASKKHARAALDHVLACEQAGVRLDDRQTVAEYLTDWLAAKALTLKPTTMFHYRSYVAHDLIPAFGAIPLEKLSHRHIDQYLHDQLDAGRGRFALRHCMATLSSALGHAVRHRRLPHNPARYTAVTRPPTVDRTCWSPGDAVTFLRHCTEVAEPLTELYEVFLGTEMRRAKPSACTGPIAGQSPASW